LFANRNFPHDRAVQFSSKTRDNSNFLVSTSHSLSREPCPWQSNVQNFSKIITQNRLKHTRLNYEFFMIWFWLFSCLSSPLYDIARSISCARLITYSTEPDFSWWTKFEFSFCTWKICARLMPCSSLLFLPTSRGKVFFRCGVSISQKKVNYGHTALTPPNFDVKLKSRNAFRHVKWWKYFSNFWHKTKILLLKYFPIHFFFISQGLLHPPTTFAYQNTTALFLFLFRQWVWVREMFLDAVYLNRN
jgi:hypothetical protein